MSLLTRLQFDSWAEEAEIMFKDNKFTYYQYGDVLAEIMDLFSQVKG